MIPSFICLTAAMALMMGWVRTINQRVQWLEEELDRRDEHVDDTL